MLTIEEAIEELESGGEVIIECEGWGYTIGQAFSFVGGDGMTGFISELLGNVAYQSARAVIENTIDELDGDYYITL